MATTRYCGRCLSTFEVDPPACPNLSCGSPRPAEGWGVVLESGDVLDRRYRVERCLAVGGAGLTYLARELDESSAPMGPRVAIKVLYNARASGPFLRRLSTEAQILQELAHENIVELRGFVHRAGHEPYLVTRFEEGGSLSQHIDRVGPPPPPVAAAILRQILLGLDVAHQRGVVHRDLKPDNVLLASETPRDRVPHVRVADFGIAKISGGMVGDRLTRMGAFVGTPEYAAPEQFEGQNPTPATDVFAAGVLFVYLLTGRPPFDFSHRADIATSYEEMLSQLPLKMAPVPGADPATMTRIQDVVGHMLVLDPQLRWTIHQILAALGPMVELAGPRAVTIETTGAPAPTRTEPQTLPLTAYPPPSGRVVPLGMVPPAVAPQLSAPDLSAPHGSAPHLSVQPPVRSFEETPVAKPIPGSTSTPLEPTPMRASDAPPPPPSTLDGIEHVLPRQDSGTSLTDAPKRQGLFPGVAAAQSPTAGLFGDAPPAPPPTLYGMTPLDEGLDNPPSESTGDLDTEDQPTVDDAAPVDDPLLAGEPPLDETAPSGLLSRGPGPPPPPVVPPPLPVLVRPPPLPVPPVVEPPPLAADDADEPPPPTWEDLPIVPPPPPLPAEMGASEARRGEGSGGAGLRLSASQTLLPVPDLSESESRVAGPVEVPAPPLAVEPPAPKPTVEVPPPPPFVASEPAPIVPRAAPAAASGARGGAAGLAGCFGLSVFGMGAVAVGGLAIVAVVLVAFAAATGWLWEPGEGGGAPNPVVVDDQDPARFRNAKPLPDAEEKKVLRTVREAKTDLAERCGTGASVDARVLVDSTGKLVYAKVEPAGLGKVDRTCVKRTLERLKVRGGVGTEGIAHVSFAF